MKKIAVIIVLLVILCLFLPKTYEWDEYVYLLNSEWFSGNQIYFENIRPPMLPLILSLIQLEGIIPYLFMILLVLITYLFYKELFNKETGLKAGALLLLSPILIFYSNKIMTSLPGAVFMMFSLYFIHKHSKTQKNQYLHLSFFFAGITALTRYPLALIYPCIILIYLIICKRNLKQLIISQIFFILPIILWINYAGIESFYYAWLWSKTLNTYGWITAFMILGPLIFLLPFLIKYKPKKEHLTFILPLIIIGLFFIIFSTSQPRFYIPIIPLITGITASSIKYKKIFMILLIFFFTVNYYLILNLQNQICSPENDYLKITKHFENKTKGNILSNLWPICSYYSKNTCYAFSENPEEFHNRIKETNAEYLLIADIKSYPEWVNDQNNFKEYEQKKLNGTCMDFYAYDLD